MQKKTVISIERGLVNKARCYCNQTCRRVVCTGIGIVSPLGSGTNYAWNKLLNSKTGVVINDRVGFEEIPSKVAAFVPTGESPGDFQNKFSKNQQKYLSLSMIYALTAAKEALVDSCWTACNLEEKQRTGVAIGCGMVDLDTISETTNTLIDHGYRRVSPYFVPKILTNLAGGHISIQYGFQGPNHSVSTACTTGAHSIGDAMRFIRNGDADVMVCGGTDAAIVPVSMAGFARAKALSTSFGNDPSVSSRPFDSKRDGFVIGEGSAVLILEELNHARRRNSKIYGEILGYGLSGDGYHMTAPREDGMGAILSMRSALRDANVTTKQVNYLNAHATSTPLGDAIENKAVKTLFGEHAYSLKISSFKGAIGHLLGAAGAVETAFTLLALYHKVIPPTLNLDKTDSEFDLNYVANESVEYKVIKGIRRIAIKNSFGFGGTNASLCLGEVD